MKKIAFILIPIYILIIALCLGFPLYEANDDVYMMDALSGNISGSPYPVSAHIHVLLGLVISTLYKIAYIPWFPIFLISVNIIGQMCIYSKIYDMLFINKINIILKCFMLIYSLTISVYLCFLPSFTTTAMLFGIIALFLLFKGKMAVSIIFLMLSLALRTESGVVSIGFWGLSYIYLHFVKNKGISLKFILIGLMVISLGIFVYTSDEFIKNKIQPKDYAGFHYQQAVFNDYPKQFKNDEELNAALDEAGWDRDLFNIAVTYFSMDRRIDTKSFSIMNKTSSKNSFSLYNSARYLWKLINTSRFITFTIFAVFIMLGIFLILSIRQKSFFLALALFIVFCVGTLYMANLSRIVFTSSCTLSIPVFYILLELFTTLNIKEHNIKYIDIAVGIISAILLIFNQYLLCFLFLILYSLINNKHIKIAPLLLAIIFTFSYSILSYRNITVLANTEMTQTKSATERKLAVTNYAQEHLENVYIISCDLVEDGIILKNKLSLNNVLFWGGTNVKSNAFNTQLQRLNIPEFDASIMLSDNVYFITRQDVYTDLLKDLLISKGYNVEINQVDLIDNTSKVIKFTSK